MPTRTIRQHRFEQHASINLAHWSREFVLFPGAPVAPYIQFREKIRDSHLHAHCADTSSSSLLFQTYI